MPDSGLELYVIVDGEDVLHVASRWLKYLHGVGRSPNTLKQYGSRVAKYLTYTLLTADWRAVNIAHLAMWRSEVATRPARKTNGISAFRSRETVDVYVTSVRSFYEWADNQGLLLSDVAGRMTQTKYFAPGTAAGGSMVRGGGWWSSSFAQPARQKRHLPNGSPTRTLELDLRN